MSKEQEPVKQPDDSPDAERIKDLEPQDDDKVKGGREASSGQATGKRGYKHFHM